MCVRGVPVVKTQSELVLGDLFVALGEETEELGLEVGLQQAVVLRLVQDEEVVLPRASGGGREKEDDWGKPTQTEIQPPHTHTDSYYFTY